MMEHKESDLKKLKENYKIIQDKYSLPEFNELNKDFGIERISDLETDFLMREIRKFMADKFQNYLRLVEAILHPVNSPMFVFSIIKTIGSEEKNLLEETYKKLAKIEVELLELDVGVSEEREKIFINESFKIWQGIKKDMLKVIETIKGNWDNKFEETNKNYFG